MTLESLLPSTSQSYLERWGLKDVPPDSDGLFGGLLLPPDQHWFLWRLSWLALVSAVYATARGLWDLCWTSWLVLGTSLLYWSKPTRGGRRALDVTMVQIAFWWQLYRAWGAEFAAPFYAISGVGCAFYAGTLYCEHRLKAMRASTLLHAGVHLCGNLANVVLYSGAIRPLSFSSPA